ncbi:MAG: sugar-binding transcriptional regulator [Alphaproteobacteria bacterium]|nr:MAG: sugar-binding transcriptional regulator [Alphaproteobacteria bacterium]
MARRSADAADDGREAELMARAAWLHFVGGLTQGEVARRLMVPVTRAHRYIARAQAEGLVRVTVDVQSAECLELETEIARRHGLAGCRVAMELPEPGPLPLRALGAAGADYLRRLARARPHRVIGIGHGRTIAAAVNALGRVDMTGMRVVSMLGGLTRSFAANPYDVIHSLARRGAADAYMLPAPMFADSADDKQVMLAQRGIAQIMALIAQATLAILGIGCIEPGESGPGVEALASPEAARALLARGARAEILGQFIDADGRVMDAESDARVMAPPLESLRGKTLVAIAGGPGKVAAIAAALRSGLLRELITDEATARALVGDGGGRAARAAE